MPTSKQQAKERSVINNADFTPTWTGNGLRVGEVLTGSSTVNNREEGGKEEIACPHHHRGLFLISAFRRRRHAGCLPKQQLYCRRRCFRKRESHSFVHECLMFPSMRPLSYARTLTAYDNAPLGLDLVKDRRVDICAHRMDTKSHQPNPEDTRR